jgi:hypothetical protein
MFSGGAVGVWYDVGWFGAMDVLSESTDDSATASVMVIEDCAGDADLAGRLVGFCDDASRASSCNFDLDDDEVLWLEDL